MYLYNNPFEIHVGKKHTGFFCVAFIIFKCLFVALKWSSSPFLPLGENEMTALNPCLTILNTHFRETDRAGLLSDWICSPSQIPRNSDKRLFCTREHKWLELHTCYDIFTTESSIKLVLNLPMGYRLRGGTSHQWFESYRTQTRSLPGLAFHRDCMKCRDTLPSTTTQTGSEWAQAGCCTNQPTSSQLHGFSVRH